MQNWHFGATDGSTNMGIVNHLTCPSCPLEDSTAHIMGGCEHTDMKKQYIARGFQALFSQTPMSQQTIRIVKIAELPCHAGAQP